MAGYSSEGPKILAISSLYEGITSPTIVIYFVSRRSWSYEDSSYLIQQMLCSIILIKKLNLNFQQGLPWWFWSLFLSDFGIGCLRHDSQNCQEINSMAGDYRRQRATVCYVQLLKDWPKGVWIWNDASDPPATVQEADDWVLWWCAFWL